VVINAICPAFNGSFPLCIAPLVEANGMMFGGGPGQA